MTGKDINNHLTARVTANHDAQNLGRVQVQFYWQEENATTWARLITSHAGAGRGLLITPEIGDEVAVRFEEADPERPCILGSVWNGVHLAPTQGLRGDEAPNNDIKRLVTKSGHRIQLSDKAGVETIALSTPTSNRLVMTERADETGRPAVVLHTDGDIILAAPKGRIHLQSMLQSREVGTSGNAAKPAAPASKQVAAAATPSDAIKWVRYKNSPTPCSNYDRMSDEEKKHATAKDKEKVPGGPAYTTVGAPLSSYKNWQQDGVDDAHKCVIQAVALNEGNDFAGVQSYDSQVLSAGSMQKTIAPDGTGELAQQLADFKKANPTKYKSLFADKGWTVETEKINPKTGKTIKTNPTAYFKDPNDPKMQPITGSALQQYIRQCDGANWEKTMKPWRDAGKDPDFQKQQINDFKSRINDTINQAVHTNGQATGYTIGDYISSSKGIAHLTDVGVNSGLGNSTKNSGLAGFFSRALTRYQAKKNKNLPTDPSKWTDEQRNGLMDEFRSVTHSDYYGKDGKHPNDRTRRWDCIENKDCLTTQSGVITQ